MPPFYYINTLGNKVSTAGPINFCVKEGPMSFCKAVTIADQPGCKYREDAFDAVHCMYWREDFDGACDCIRAQRGMDPKTKENKTTPPITGTEVIPT